MCFQYGERIFLQEFGLVFFFFSFLFRFTGHYVFFPSRSVFALGTPLRLVADTAAADLVLSLRLNKHSCPDWQNPCLWFPQYLHRQGC